MKKIIIITLLFPFLSFGQMAPQAENAHFTSQIDEKVAFFTDRNLYLSGEEIWFSAFVLINKNFSEASLSKVLYLELYDKTTKVIRREKFNIVSNTCNGTFQIPNETLSEVYFLRAYTQFQRNGTPTGLATIPVTIVNPELTLTTIGKSSSNISENKTLTENIRVTPQKTNFDNREKVELTLQWKGQSVANVAVSVVRNGTLIINEFGEQPQLKDYSRQKDSVFWIPDVRGASLSGFVREKTTGKAAANLTVFLSVFGKDPIFHITQTQPNGAFLFSLEKLTLARNVFVSIDPTINEGMEVLINNDFSNFFPEVPDYPFLIDTTYQDLLTEMYVALQSSRAFSTDVPQPTNEFEGSNFPDNFDFSIKLDDFIELASLEEVIYEIVPPLSVRTEKHRKQLAVANYQTQRVASADMVLLDNVPVFNIDELLKISPANIERIDVINRPYYLGDTQLTSIVSFKTKTGDFGGYKFPSESVFLEYQTLSVTESPCIQDYSFANRKSSPIPDFRTLLYANPHVKINHSDTTLEFFTSDNKGRYDIFVRGISDTGEPVFGKSSITIK